MRRLSDRQKDILRRYINVYEAHQLVITIHPLMRFTREAGGGSGHWISVRIIYAVDGEDDLRVSREALRIG